MDRASVGQLTQSRSSTEVRTATAAERSSRRARREERMRRRGAAQIRLEEEVYWDSHRARVLCVKSVLRNKQVFIGSATHA